ncbi:LamG-like jellyroll fold domain-containing protein [Actinacidiphila acididurans]|uniref:Tat pathway signal sequence domain protein n=1 Tax=Actinacidiphila acididurans TaxID=2784346 RepID=A0ABS2U4I7_9ACTN|nr:LamG-like jellyroll fold domain-containing protein [Actinacidiphila acididurans]MBM9510528.1 Tat pathway signal sequence domain protein [Actinacidiphila acididurans]
MSTNGDNPSQETTGQSRRGFLRNAAIAGAGAAAVVGVPALGATPAFAADDTKSGRTGSWSPDATALQFTLAVMPDTQFLYWGSQDSVNRTPQEESFRYIIDNSGNADNNIVFMAHLGDLTQDGDPTSFQQVDKAFALLDTHGVAYSVLAGNHDVSGDDSRGDTSYLQTMGPQRFKRSRTFVGSDPTGYNTAHIFQAAGRSWLVLALDWRTTDQGYAWANSVIKAHPKMPVILTSHDIVASPYDDNVFPYESGDPENNAVLEGNGQAMWDKLINDNDQVFLTLNGHYWPPGRMTKKNAAGNDVYMHITNYQNRYFGGGGMIRLYHFDLTRNMIDVETINPWILAQEPESRNELAAELARVTGPVDNFSIPIDFEQRFSSFAPVAVRPARPAAQELVKGTLAYWRFDAQGAPGTSLTSGQTVRDLSGQGNDLTVVTVPGTAADALTWSDDHHPDQPGHASLKFVGGRNPVHGTYLTTAAQAPLNAETFASGYTIETFVMMPLDWDAGNNGWASILSRRGSASAAGKHGKNTDPGEPVVQFAISNNGREPQFNHYPLNDTYPTTNWGHGLVELRWWHLAVVNDGRYTKLYVEGAPVVDNPSRLSVGLTSLGLPWLVGGHEYAGAIDIVFHGNVGDIRIVNRPLSSAEFLTAK